MPEFKTENALLLATRPLGERSGILSVFTAENGRFAGVLKTKKLPDIGSFLTLRWQARLADQLGTFYLDDTRSLYVSVADDRLRLAVLSCVCELLHTVLPERQNFADLYTATVRLLNKIEESAVLQNYLRWEITVLSAIGFGLDFSECAGGGDKNDLAYVSPKSGRAVSREKGKPYQNKLLALPRFLWCATQEEASHEELIQAFTLTTYFFTTHAGINRLPLMREQLLHCLKK